MAIQTVIDHKTIVNFPKGRWTALQKQELTKATVNNMTNVG